MPALLDTDMLSEILKQEDSAVVEKAASYLQGHGRFAFSAITRYEIVRGLKVKKASRQLENFATFCRICAVLPITDQILDRAAEMWVTAHDAGMPRNDADLIIAATAVSHQRMLVTGNTAHFSWIPGLALDDWRCP